MLAHATPMRPPCDPCAASVPASAPVFWAALPLWRGWQLWRAAHKPSGARTLCGRAVAGIHIGQIGMCAIVYPHAKALVPPFRRGARGHWDNNKKLRHASSSASIPEGGRPTVM